MAFKAVRDFLGRFAVLGAFPLSSPDQRALVTAGELPCLREPDKHLIIGQAVCGWWPLELVDDHGG
jgi:hypothetical protein